MLHVTREVFLFLSAFVLAYTYRSRPLDRMSFWRRRYRLVLAPYVVWTTIYVLADGSLSSPLGVVGRVARDLLTGEARYHLYFLLVTFQLYAVFPWALAWFRRHPVRPRPLLVASATFQIAFTAAIHYRLTMPGPLGAWLTDPGSWLPSYQFYIVAGLVAALHLEELTAWTRRHGRAITYLTVVAFGAGFVSYLVDLRVLGMTPVHASEVFQPVVVVESVAAIAAQYLFGLWVAERISNRGRRRLETASDVSFGVYLAHPLLLQGLIAVAASAGLSPLFDGIPGSLAVGAVLVLLVPALYLCTGGLASLVRRSPASLALIGRPARGTRGAFAKSAVPAGAASDVGSPIPGLST
jgi:surface polysaccharide O-acyltransferase-like enzyme